MSLTSTPTPAAPLRWNWPHLLLLAALPPYAWACGRAGLQLSLGTLLALAWLMWAERRWPARRGWTPGRDELWRDGGFLGLNALTDALGGLLLAVLALHLRQRWPADAGLAAAWSPWLALPVAVALGELGPYALHRWAHGHGWGGRWGWSVHQLHHVPGRVNASNNLATHPINVLWNQLSRFIPWLLLGLDAQVVAWAALFIQVQSFAVHANVAGTMGPLNRLIGTAELHRWHHSIHPGEALNYGTAIPLWDQLFGSYRAPGATGPARVGVLGLPGTGPWALWRGLLLAPLCAVACRANGATGRRKPR